LRFQDADWSGTILIHAFEMYLLLTDETNKEESVEIRFFIYGGLFVPANKAVQIHNEIEAARKSFGYQQADLLKFDTNIPLPVLVPAAGVAVDKLAILRGEPFCRDSAPAHTLAQRRPCGRTQCRSGAH
jgi:hypothetical protein